MFGVCVCVWSGLRSPAAINEARSDKRENAASNPPNSRLQMQPVNANDLWGRPPPTTGSHLNGSLPRSIERSYLTDIADLTLLPLCTSPRSIEINSKSVFIALSFMRETSHTSTSHLAKCHAGGVGRCICIPKMKSIAFQKLENEQERQPHRHRYKHDTTAE